MSVRDQLNELKDLILLQTDVLNRMEKNINHIISKVENNTLQITKISQSLNKINDNINRSELRRFVDDLEDR